MIGEGRTGVAQIADPARAIVSDGLPNEAVQAFASQGTDGRYPSNQERDLHRWLRNLWNFNLEPHSVLIELDASCLQALGFPKVFEGMVHFWASGAI